MHTTYRQHPPVQPSIFEHVLTDTRGLLWTFVVSTLDHTVLVRSPVHSTGEPCTLKYHTVFMRDTVEQLPGDVVADMLAKARVFSREYSPVVKPYTHDDWVRNCFEVGITIRFSREHPSVVLQTEDARRLWGLLRTAR